MQQLVLDFGGPVVPPDTVVSRCNEAAYALLARYPSWPHHAVLVTGPDGAGKSHLARRFCERAGGMLVPGAVLGAEDPVALVRRPVAVDDAQLADERALFHLLNAARSAGGTVLLTADAVPMVSIRDLASRLNHMPEVALAAPDDALLRRVMLDAFARRQLAADTRVVDFLMLRMKRTLHDALHLVAEIDRRGLAEQRGPTRPLASDVLRQSSPAE